ncbi:MAG: M81 family metallopeptidase [Chloroflexi bacterium]|nr:M81 family metallopeptidase [Chloroflexota bacterium]
MRIAIGAIATESCTFSPLPTRRTDFATARGDELLQRYPFLSQFEAEFIPTLGAWAMPGGVVEPDAYQEFKFDFLQALRQAGPLDGLYLELHGAMYVRGLDDAEGDWVTAARRVVGPDCLISVSLDLHGNVTQQLVDQADILTAFRTAPHRDYLETRERACVLLVRSLKEGLQPQSVWIRVPVILPGERTSTDVEPAASLYTQLEEVDRLPGILTGSIMVGYVWADDPHASASVIVTGTDRALAQQQAARLAQRYWDVRGEFGFGVEAASIDECIRLALEAPEFTVFVSDAGDNPTGGGVGDVPVFLERLLAHEVPDAVVASIVDPAAVAACRAAGLGAEVNVSLGGKLDPFHGSPLPVKGRVVHLAPQGLRGSTGFAEIGGDQAVLQVRGVQVIVTERRKSFRRLDDFRQAGINPLAHKIIVVKMGYLVPDLQQAAPRALLALSPGAVDQAIERLPYRRIRRPIYPLDPDMKWQVPGFS